MAPITFVHALSGRSFTATEEGAYGAASLAGRWDSGEAGVIWPTETLVDGTRLWVAS